MSAAAALSAAGHVVQGIGSLVAGLHNAKVLKRQAREELAAGQANERELRAEARAVIGAQLAAQWANGMEGGSGTALAALRESEIDAAMDAAELRRQAILKAQSLRSSASAAKRQGFFDLASGLLGAGTSASVMRNDWAQARNGAAG